MEPWIVDSMNFLVNVGLLDVILPFMFIFTILFAMLQKSRVLGTINGEPKANFNAVFAFVVSFFFIASLSRVHLLSTILWKLSLFIVIIIMSLLILSFFGLKSGFEKKTWIFVLSGIIVAGIFLTSLGWFSFSDLEIIFSWIFHPITISALLFIGVLWFIMYGSDDVPTSKDKKVDSKDMKPSEKKADVKKPSQDSPSKQPNSFVPKKVGEYDFDDLYSGEPGTVWKE